MGNDILWLSWFVSLSLSLHCILLFSSSPLSTLNATTHTFLYIKSGLCPDNLFFHAVTCQLVKLELEALNFAVDFATVEVEGGAAKEGTWEGLRRKYWHGRAEYYLPGKRTLSRLMFFLELKFYLVVKASSCD